MKRGGILFVTMLLWVGLVTLVDAQNVSPASLFDQASAEYRTGNFKKAIELYESILKSGQESGPLHYNLGNSYFKENQLGKAIAEYERARRLMPRDADVQANYRFALLNVKNKGGTTPKPVYEKILRDYAESFTGNELMAIVFGLFFLTGGMYFIGLFLKWPLKLNIGVLIISCSLLFFHGFVFFSQNAAQVNLAVVLKSTSAQFEPLENATAHYELAEGQKVKILKTEPEWFKIKRLDGKIGWVKRDVVERI